MVLARNTTRTTDHNRNDVLLGKGDSNSAGEFGNAQRAWRIMDLESGESDGEVDGVRCRRYHPMVGRRPDMIMAASSSAMASVSSYRGRVASSLAAATCRRTEGLS